MKKWKNMRPLYRAVILIIMSAFFFALMNTFVHMAGDLPATQKSFFRNLIAFIIAAAAIAKQKTPIKIGRKNYLPIFLRSLFGTVGILCNFYALDKLPIADASILNKMSPFFVIVFSVMILKEKITLPQFLFVSGALCGAMFVVKPDFSSAETLPALIALTGGICAGLAYTLVRLMTNNGVKGVLIVAFFSGFSCLFTLPFLIFDFHPMTFSQVLILLGAGASAAGGQFTITAAYANAPAREVSIYDYTQIIFAAALGFIAFGQIPDVLSLIGYAIIIAMAVMMFVYNNRRYNNSEKSKVKKVKKKMLVKILIIVFAAVAVLYLGSAAYLAKYLSFSNGLSPEEEKKWAQENGVWTDLDSYTVDDYTVSGKDDYTLHCFLVSTDKTKDTGKYVIISHGYNSNRNGAVKYVPVYVDLGYSCVIYDLRGHGENEKTVCTIGNYESQDLICIINDTYERFGSDIYLGLHGESMGSSTSLSALAYSPDVHFVVADCGFTNLYELIGKQFSERHMGFEMPAVDLMQRLLYSWSMKDTHAIDALEGNNVPICFIHGSADTFITPDNSERMKEKTSGYSEIHIVDGAEHAQSRKVLGKEAYEAIVASFLEEVEKREETQQ